MPLPLSSAVCYMPAEWPDGPTPCGRDDLGDARLSDPGEAGEHDEAVGHATTSGVIAATLSRSARRSSRSS